MGMAGTGRGAGFALDLLTKRKRFRDVASKQREVRATKYASLLMLSLLNYLVSGDIYPFHKRKCANSARPGLINI